MLIGKGYFWVVATRDGDGHIAIKPHFNKGLSEILKDEREEGGCDIVAAEYWHIVADPGDGPHSIEIIAR